MEGILSITIYIRIWLKGDRTQQRFPGTRGYILRLTRLRSPSSLDGNCGRYTFHRNIHPNMTKRRSYSAEISRHPRLHTSLNAPTIPILLGLSTWREKKYSYKDGELELWTVLWPYEFLLTRVPLHYGSRQVRTLSWADMWLEFVLVYNLSKTTFVKFYVGLFAYRKIQMRVNK